MPSFSTMSEADLINWMTNCLAVADSDPEAYGLTVAKLSAMGGRLNELIAKRSARLALEDAAKAATAAQTASRKLVEADGASVETIVSGNPDISDADKIAIGIEPRKAPTYTAPVAATELVASGYENGTNVLKWNRAGNKPGTIFIAECREGDETDFKYLGAVTKTSFEHKNAVPGRQCVYRVKSQRGGEESEYSNTAVVYMK